MSEEREVFEGWAILELMGHRRLAGYVREQEIAGAAFVRLDVPSCDPEADPDARLATQFYSPSAVYCLTPTSETTARQVAMLARPTPVQRWELPPAPTQEARPSFEPDVADDEL